MRYFPLSASRLPLCKFVRASIFQRLVREKIATERTHAISVQGTHPGRTRARADVKKEKQGGTSETFSAVLQVAEVMRGMT